MSPRMRPTVRESVPPDATGGATGVSAGPGVPDRRPCRAAYSSLRRLAKRAVLGVVHSSQAPFQASLYPQGYMREVGARGAARAMVGQIGQVQAGPWYRGRRSRPRLGRLPRLSLTPGLSTTAFADLAGVCHHRQACEGPPLDGVGRGSTLLVLRILSISCGSGTRSWPRRNVAVPVPAHGGWRDTSTLAGRGSGSGLSLSQPCDRTLRRRSASGP